MSRILAIVGSAIFLVIAPGIVAGYIPWWICRWHVGAPLLGNLLLAGLGNVLYCGGSPSASGLLRSLRPPRSRYARAALPKSLAAPFITGLIFGSAEWSSSELLCRRGGSLRATNLGCHLCEMPQPTTFGLV